MERQIGERYKQVCLCVHACMVACTRVVINTTLPPVVLSRSDVVLCGLREEGQGIS